MGKMWIDCDTGQVFSGENEIDQYLRDNNVEWEDREYVKDMEEGDIYYSGPFGITIETLEE